MVEKIGDIGLEVVGVEDPSAVRDGDAELMFLVALTVERQKAAYAGLVTQVIQLDRKRFRWAALDSSVRRRRGMSNEGEGW